MWGLLTRSFRINLPWTNDDSSTIDSRNSETTNSTGDAGGMVLGHDATVLLQTRQHESGGRSRVMNEGANLTDDVPKYCKEIFKEYKFVFQGGDLDYD